MYDRFDEAIEYYHKALALHPSDTFCATMLTHALQDSAQYEPYREYQPGSVNTDDRHPGAAMLSPIGDGLGLNAQNSHSFGMCVDGDDDSVREMMLGLSEGQGDDFSEEYESDGSQEKERYAQEGLMGDSGEDYHSCMSDGGEINTSFVSNASSVASFSRVVGRLSVGSDTMNSTVTSPGDNISAYVSRSVFED